MQSALDKERERLFKKLDVLKSPSLYRRALLKSAEKIEKRIQKERTARRWSGVPRRRSRSPERERRLTRSSRYLKSREFGSPVHKRMIARYSKRLDDIGE